MTTTTTTPAKLSTSGPPAAASAEMRDLVTAYTNRVGWFDGRPRYVSEPPDPARRAILQRRMDDLDAALAHRDRPALERALGALFTLMRTSQDDRRSINQVVSAYAALLGELPSWAVSQACGKIVRGGGSNATFAPGAPELYQLAKAETAAVREERARIMVLLTAPPPALPEPELSAEEVQRRQERVASAKAGLVEDPVEAAAAARRAAESARMMAADERRRRSELRSAGHDPDRVTVSLAVLKSLERAKQRQAAE